VTVLFKARTRSILVGVGLFLLAKFKWVLALLKWTKFGGTLITMGASLGAYALFYGWKFAAALVYLISVHEMGHVVAAKRKGIPTSPAIFIPFVGAMIAMKRLPRDAATEAYLAYGGPLAGLISFLPAVLLYQLTGDPFWSLVIFMGALLNLFNLIPVSPLDGGRIVSVLSTKIWLVGLVGLGVLLIFSPGPILLLILLFGLMTWWGRAREGYRSSVLLYEKDKLTEYRDSLRQWPFISTTVELKESLLAVSTDAAQIEASGRKWLIPFVHDKQRLVRDRARLDREYAERARVLLLEWEYQPAQYIDADPSRPVPSELLTKAEEEAEERIAVIEEELHKLRTYYEAPASVKWKVLTAYLVLAAILSLFALYGFNLMESHQIDFR
jgi:Zn-dependent protease